MQPVLFDATGHRRSPATVPGYHRGRPPHNKGEHYPADPPTIEEIVAVMRAIGDRADGQRLRADRPAVAGRSQGQRGARANGERPRPDPRRDPSASWQGRPMLRAT